MKGLLTFLAGAGAGSFITFLVLKDRYRKYAQEEIDSVKEIYGVKKKEEPEEEPIVKAPKQTEYIKTSLDTAKRICEDNGYTNYHEVTKVPENGVADKPYVISPNDYGEYEDYTRVSLSYYADGILTDENDEPVSIENTVGNEALTTFGEYEDDAVHVRNDAKKCDYEVLLDNRKYEEVYRR